MSALSQSLRIVFSASILTSSFWLIGFAWESIAGRDAPVSVLIILAMAISASGSWLTFRKSRLAIPETIRFAELLKLLLSRFVVSYLSLVPICGFSVWGLIQLMSREPSHPDALLFVWLFALWFPLWLAPALASYLSWRALVCSRPA